MSENEKVTNVTSFEVEHLTDNKTKIENKVLEEISKQLNIYTSTPTQLNIMDLSFLKCYENVVGSGMQAVDSDSGYMSNPLEGTLDKEDPTMFINKSPPFMSEDALLEKPVRIKKSQPNQYVYQEQMSYLSSMHDETNVTDGSIVPETEEETDDTNDVTVSPILPIERLPVVVTLDVEECSNSSNKENVNVSSFVNQSLEKMAKMVKITPRKKRKSPRKRKRSSSMTPQKAYLNKMSANLSPDLFDDEPLIIVTNKSDSFSATEQYVQKGDHLLIKRINQCMSGVLPPPSVTTTNITVAQMLEKIKSEKHQVFFWNIPNVNSKTNNLSSTSAGNGPGAGIGTLLVNTDFEAIKIRDWPSILQDRQHGLNYNHSKVAEDIEALFMKYSQRYIGAETQSSCTIFDSNANTPSRRKANRLRWVNNSPGRRLSHLARRRITFSSANIQAAASSSHSRQIMVDAKRFELLSRRVSPRKGKSPRKTPRKGKTPRKTPRKSKTPRKTPRKPMCTPSSSTKKRLALKVLDDENSERSTSLRASATKRALFQSPEKNVKVTRVARMMLPSTSKASLSPWKKRNTPKRSLFMSPTKTQENSKRKRLDSDDYTGQCKIARSLSLQHDNQANKNNSSLLLKVKSESLLHGHVEMSDHHKKKLQWAVYEALRSVNIRVDHENFRQYASVLARVTRRLLPTVSTSNTGTSERMLRITKQHVYAVIKGKTVDEIVKTYEMNRTRLQKPSGYVPKEETTENKERMDVAVARSNVFQDCANTIQSSEKKNVPVDKKVVDNKIDRVKKIIKF